MALTCRHAILWRSPFRARLALRRAPGFVFAGAFLDSQTWWCAGDCPVVAVDMALHRGLVDRAGLRAHVAEHPPCGGLVQARRVVEL